MPPTVFFFKIVLPSLGSLHFCINFRISLSMFTKKGCWNFDQDYIESTDQFWENCYVYNIASIDE